jgi:hypothetical protein
MLALLRKVWATDPDLRLMQLLGNVYGSGREYYIEDEDLEKALRASYFGETDVR